MHREYLLNSILFTENISHRLQRGSPAGCSSSEACLGTHSSKPQPSLSKVTAAACLLLGATTELSLGVGKLGHLPADCIFSRAAKLQEVDYNHPNISAVSVLIFI